MSKANELMYLHQKSDDQNESGIYRSHLVKGQLDLIKSPSPEIETLYDLIQMSLKKYGDNICCGHREIIDIITETKELFKNEPNSMGRNKDKGTEESKKSKIVKSWNYYKLSPYIWLTFREFYEKINALGSALHSLKLQPGDKVAIYTSTSWYWTTMAHACYTLSLVVVTIYETLGEEGLIHALNECSVSTLLIADDSLGLVHKVLDKARSLKTVIYHGNKLDNIEMIDKFHQYNQQHLEKLDGDQPQSIDDEKRSVRLIKYEDFILIGEEDASDHLKPDKDDIACIMYTSGSTGTPKGVLITHGNIIASIAGASKLISPVLKPTDTIISFLPLSHIFAFSVDAFSLYSGFKIGYSNPRTLVDSAVRDCRGDLAELKPDLMVGVPQVYDMIRKGILCKIESSNLIVKAMFKLGYSIKKNQTQKSFVGGLIDKLIFAKLKALTGGNLRIAVSGGAPLAEHARLFISNTLVQLSQGYGLTETCGLTFITTPDIVKPNIVGQMGPQNEIKRIIHSLLICIVVSVPDAGYLVSNPNPQGELWFRGYGVAKGYYRNPEATLEAFTQEGWFKTGDVGQINKDGTLSIIDRVKNLVKLANGEYIALEKLESVYKACVLVQNLCVYASSLHQKPLLVVVPNLLAFSLHAKSKGLDEINELSDIANNQELKMYLLEQLLLVAKKLNLKSHETVIGICVSDFEWSTDVFFIFDLYRMAFLLRLRNLIGEILQLDFNRNWICFIRIANFINSIIFDFLNIIVVHLYFFS